MSNPPKYNLFNISENYKFFFLFLMTLMAIYLPCLAIPYGYHDDFHFFPLSSNGIPITHPQTEVCLALGRVGNAVLINFWKMFVQNLSDLSLLRFFMILQLAIAGTVLYRFLKSLLNNSLLGYLVVVSVFTLPAFQVATSWVSAPIATTVMLAAFAAFYASKIPREEIPWQRCFLKHNCFLSIVLLLLSLTIYPAASGFYWVIAFVAIAISSQESTRQLRRSVLNFLLPALCSYAFLAVYFKALKGYSSRFVTEVFGEQSIYNLYSAMPNIPEKIVWFFTVPLYESLNLWNVFPTWRLSFIVGGILLGLIVLWIYQVIKQNIPGPSGKLNTAAWLLLSFSGCLILSFLPNLVTAQNISFYRCSAGLTSLLIILAILLLKNVLPIICNTLYKLCFVFLLLALAIVGATSAQDNVWRYRVKPSYNEFLFLKNEFAQALKQNAHRIHLNALNPKFYPQRYDEFATLTKAFELNQVIFSVSAFREFFVEQGYTVHAWHTYKKENGRLLVFNLEGSSLGHQPFEYEIFLTVSADLVNQTGRLTDGEKAFSNNSTFIVNPAPPEML